MSIMRELKKMVKKTKLYYAILLTMALLTQVQASDDNREEMGVRCCFARCLGAYFIPPEKIRLSSPPPAASDNFPYDILNYAFDRKKEVTIHFNGSTSTYNLVAAPVSTDDEAVTLFKYPQFWSQVKISSIEGVIIQHPFKFYVMRGD